MDSSNKTRMLEESEKMKKIKIHIRMIEAEDAREREGSYFANWEVASCFPRSNGKEVPLSILPYKPRLKK